MVTTALRPCIDCGRLAHQTRCPPCARAARPQRTTTRHTGTATYRRARAMVLHAAGHRCHYCGRPATEVDHAIPVSRGGTNDPANLRASCRACNRSKGAKLP